MFRKGVECGRRQPEGNLYQKPHISVLTHFLNLLENDCKTLSEKGMVGNQHLLSPLIVPIPEDGIGFVSSHLVLLTTLISRKYYPYFTDAKVRVREVS